MKKIIYQMRVGCEKVEFNTWFGAALFSTMTYGSTYYVEEREVYVSPQMKPNAPISVARPRLESVLVSGCERSRFYPFWERENWQWS